MAEASAQPHDGEEIATEGPSAVSMKYVLDLYDALTHCNEPLGHHKLVDSMEEAVKAEEIGKSNPEPVKKEGSHRPQEQHETQASKEPRYVQPEDLDIANGLYTISGFDKSGLPVAHRSWKPEWVVVYTAEVSDNEDEEPRYYFQVFQSEQDLARKVNHEKHLREERVPEWKEDRLVYHFAAKYAMGKAAFNEQGRYKFGLYTPVPDRYNYAEHALIGDGLDLRWSENKSTKGQKFLNFQNGEKRTYGQINALAGDFFGTVDPICLGSDFDDQCARFLRAYDTLATNTTTTINEVSKIVANREKEVEMLKNVDPEKDGTGVKGYKSLYEKGEAGLPAISKEEEQFEDIMSGRPEAGYLQLAQLNLDHFGANGRTAYNAGHTCALRKAAEGDLETAYTMNAFADHFLGDAFAAGHIRTPRAKLHGDPAVAAQTIQAIIKALRNNRDKSLLSWLNPLPKANALKEMLINGSSEMALDVCAKFMHDEDNALGLQVGNELGEEWRAYGDKRLLDKSNETNRIMMKKALQASVNEVYAAYDSKTVQPTPEKYEAWQIAPTKVLPGNHSPLFTSEGHYRDPIDDSKSTTYYDPAKNMLVGYRVLVKRMQDSDHFQSM